MTGVQLGGIDPSILRELSGVYKPFMKALKNWPVMPSMPMLIMFTLSLPMTSHQ